MNNGDKIVDLLKKGIVPGLGGAKPKHIVTTISNVFIFEDKAYKIYKGDNDLFNKNYNDLSNKESRFAFTRRDFEWNNLLSPEIYTRLRGVVLQGGAIAFTEPTDDSDELAIEMNKIDMSSLLIKRLMENRISLEDCFEMGKQFGEKVSHVPKLTITMTAYEDFLTRYHDFIPWVRSVKSIPQDKAEKYLDFMKDFIESHKDELNSKDLMGVCVDVHADNVVLAGKAFSLFDTYAPKEAWLHGYKFINIYRLATDIYAFLGKEYFEKVLQGYKDTTHEELPRKYDKFLVVYCGLVTWPYQYMLSDKEPERLVVAKKYEAFIESMF